LLQIADIKVQPGLLLAPMEDVTELPFRLICRELGADIVYTEFVNAEGLLREAPDGPRRTFGKLRFLEEERPLGIQLYGATSLSMEKAAEIASAQNPDLIDINCGCWVSNVALRGAGAGLLRDLPQMKEVVRRVISATHLPVTVKTRLGWDQGNIQILEVARMLEDLGVQALSIHCRTRSQGHKGQVDYSWIAKVKEVVSMPVILNGDIVTAQDAKNAFETTGCDGVMIGRGAIAHPWIFREARHYLQTGELLPGPTLKERAELCLKHLELCVEHGTERYALIGMRRHYSGYFRGLHGASQLRAELSSYKELEPLLARLQELCETERLAA
jgi:tRNA-dihydrouridine synthase B